MKKAFSLILRTGISAALLVILFRKIDFHGTLKVIASLKISYFILATVTFFIIYFLVFYRWRTLLKAQGLNLPLSRVLSSYSGGIFFSLFLPSTIGGDVARSIDLGTHTQRHNVIVASVLLDRISGFVGLVIVALVFLGFSHNLINEPSVYGIVFLLALLLGTILLFIFNKGIYNWINHSSKKGGFRDTIRCLHSEIYFFRSKPSVLILVLIYSITIQLFASVSSYFLLCSLGAKINILYPLVLTPVIAIITALPISIGGLGLRDASSIFFYTKVGVAKDIALGQSLLNFAIMVCFGLIGGIIYVSSVHNRRLQPHKTNTSK